MPHFSFSTVLMALLTSNIIAVLIAIPFLKKDFVPCISYKFLSCFIALALFRLLLPFEFPFTNNIFLPQSISRITAFLWKPQINVIGSNLSLWNILELVWVMGIAIKFFYSIKNYRRFWNYISQKGIDKTSDPKYKLLLDDICRRHNKNNNFHVLELSTLTAPIIWNAKEPCIILPGTIDIPSDKLQYVLYHETLHYFRHDFLVKKAIDFLAIIYWWNPACVLLQKHADLLLEMYVDRAVTKGNPDIIQEYTECLLYLKCQAQRLSQDFMAAFERRISSLVQPHDNSLEKRVAMLMRKPSAFQKASVNIFFAVLIVFVLAWSHLYILETAYYPTSAEEALLTEGETILDATAENAYFIADEFSHYKLYINGIYIDTVTSLEYYPKGIRIYNQKGELIDET